MASDLANLSPDHRDLATSGPDETGNHHKIKQKSGGRISAYF